MTHVVGQYGYAAGWATDTAGRAIVASRDAGTLTSAEQAAATQAVREGRESIVGPLREPDGQLVLSFVEPVGVPSMRTSSAPWGAVVLRTAMKVFEVDTLTISPWALREGIVLRYIDALDGRGADPVVEPAEAGAARI